MRAYETRYMKKKKYRRRDKRKEECPKKEIYIIQNSNHIMVRTFLRLSVSTFRTYNTLTNSTVLHPDTTQLSSSYSSTQLAAGFSSRYTGGKGKGNV